MKNMSLLLASAMLGCLVLAIVMMIGGYMNRRVELQSELSAAMEQTVEQMAGETPDITESWAAVAESVEIMAAGAETDSTLELSVYGVDAGKGMLAMKAEEQFFHPDGREASTAWERTVIYNRRTEEGSACYEVRFYRTKADMLGEQNCYKAYTVQEGQALLAPAAPVREDAQFAGWLDFHDYMADFSQPVEQSCSYYAEWE